MYRVYCDDELFTITKRKDLADLVALQCINRNYGRIVTVEHEDTATVLIQGLGVEQKQIRPKRIAVTLYELIEAMGYEPIQMVGVVVKDEAPTLIAFYPKNIDEDGGVTMGCTDKEYHPKVTQELAHLDMEEWLQLAMYKAGDSNAR